VGVEAGVERAREGRPQGGEVFGVGPAFGALSEMRGEVCALNGSEVGRAVKEGAGLFVGEGVHAKFTWAFQLRCTNIEEIKAV
jgi:hypothetical protein